MSVEDVAADHPGALAHLGEKHASHPPRAEILDGSAAPAQKSERLSATLDHAGVGIIEIDAEGRLLRVNTHLCELMGCDPEYLLGRSIFDETYAEVVASDRTQFQRQVAGEIDRYTTEKRIRRKDGRYFWASVNSTSVRDPGGRFLYAVRVLQDITDRKQAEAALAQRMEEQGALSDFTEATQHARSPEQVRAAALRCDRAAIPLADTAERMQAERAAQHLAAIVESSEDVIISKNLEGIILTWNRGAERIFGYKAHEVIGRPVNILIPEDRQDEEPKILARIRAGERVDPFETIRQHKDGHLIDISLTISPIRDECGRIIGASKIARDITERKEAVLKLRESAQQLKDLLAAIPAAIYTTDAQGRITYYNDKAVELAGRVPVIGCDEWCVTWKLYWPDGTPLPHDQCPMAIALKEGRAIRDAEAVAERPDGTRVPFIPYPTPLRDGEGRITGAINMLVDISERKQAETQQRVLLNELNHRVKNNMQMLQSLLANAARNTQHAEAKQVLAEASDRLAAMSAAQRVLYGTADATQFDGAEFLGAVCKTAQRTFPEHIRIDCHSDVGQLPNDSAMPLALILNELLTNAVKHGMKGRQGTLQVGLERDGAGFVLYVTDEGPGFDLDAVVQRSSGLQLVQGLARQLRGRFEVRRDPTRCVLHFT
jgi:PAS domain S-box-containing protein